MIFHCIGKSLPKYFVVIFSSGKITMFGNSFLIQLKNNYYFLCIISEYIDFLFCGNKTIGVFVHIFQQLNHQLFIYLKKSIIYLFILFFFHETN